MTVLSQLCCGEGNGISARDSCINTPALSCVLVLRGKLNIAHFSTLKRQGIVQLALPDFLAVKQSTCSIGINAWWWGQILFTDVTAVNILYCELGTIEIISSVEILCTCFKIGRKIWFSLTLLSLFNLGGGKG